VVIALSSFLVLFGLSGACLGAAGWLTWRLTPEAKRGRLARWLAVWSGRGVGLPLLVWGLMNVGLSWNLQPFMPMVQAAQNSGAGWIPEFIYVLGLGSFIISSYWAAGTLAWVLYSTAQVTEEGPRKDFKSLCLTCTLALSLPVFCILVLGGFPWLGVAGLVLLVPMAAYAPGLLYPPALPPMYARAIARLKFGKYTEAEMEIIRELEKCEDDFEGWMMLAELYANQFGDLGEAERTVLDICRQPRTTPPQLSQALHRLADWQLKLAGDPEAARRSLQLICQRLPRTHLARMAQLRRNQLPRTAEDLREGRAGRSIPLPALGDQLEQEIAPLDKKTAAAAANACVERLKQDPNDAAAREKLARLFAEHLQRPELGLEQVRQLLTVPDQPEGKRADWMALLAAWELKYRHDGDAGQKWLAQLISEFPASPQAFAARRRLQLLESEARQKSAAEVPLASGIPETPPCAPGAGSAPEPPRT
jgi:tetratricopeptide (TPR) repeat protein